MKALWGNKIIDTSDKNLGKKFNDIENEHGMRVPHDRLEKIKSKDKIKSENKL